MQTILVHNAKAGAGEVPAEELTQIIEQAGHEVSYVSKSDKSIAKRLRQPADLIVVAGGDGTFGEVAVTVSDRAPPIAVIPVGTANNVAASLGIAGSPREIVARWEAFVRRPFDLWEVTGPWGRRLFVEGCGLGALTQSSVEMASRETASMSADDKLGLARRLFYTAAQQMKAVPVRAALDGETIEGEFVLFEVLNISTVGPSLMLAPHADSGDGWLDVAMVSAKDAAAAATPHDVRKCRHVHVACRGGRVRLDDVCWPEPDENELSAPWTMEIRPAGRSLTVLVPEQAPFLMNLADQNRQSSL